MNKRALSTIALLGATGAVVAGGVAVGAGGVNEDQSASLAGKIDSSRPGNVILFLGDGMGDRRSRPPATTGRRRGPSEHGPPAVHRDVQTTWSVKPAAARPTARLRPRLRLDRHDVVDRPARRSTSASRQGPSTRVDVPGSNLPTTSESRAEAGQGGRQRVDGRDHRRDAGRARLAHLASAAARARPTRDACPTETKAAGGLGSIAEQQVDHQRRRRPGRRPRPLRADVAGGRTPADGDRSPPQAQGYTYVTDADRPRRGAALGPPAARPLRTRQHDDGVDRPGRRPAATGTPAQRAKTDRPPGERAEPGRR